MATRSQMALVAKFALLSAGFAIAAAAFVHAASEAEISIGGVSPGRLGLNAHIAGKVVDSGFRTEMARQAPKTQGEFPSLSDAVVGLAKETFAVDPLEVSSLRTIALGATLHEDELRARRIMRLASRISKRDSITDLWLAQDYGRAGDVEEMLASFDHALRTSARAREFAMKPVVDALANAASHRPLGKLLSGRPEWENDFWQEFARNPAGNAHAVEFLRNTGISVGEIPEKSRQVLYANLKRTQHYDALYGLAVLDPEAREGLKVLGAGKFVTTEDGNPLGWTLRSQGNFAARVHATTGELQIDARSGSFGIAADRVVRGRNRQRLTIEMAEPLPANAELELALRCANGTKRKVVSILLNAGDRFGEALPMIDCDFATLELSFSSHPGRQDAYVRVARIELQEVAS